MNGKEFANTPSIQIKTFPWGEKPWFTARGGILLLWKFIGVLTEFFLLLHFDDNPSLILSRDFEFKLQKNKVYRGEKIGRRGALNYFD